MATYNIHRDYHHRIANEVQLAWMLGRWPAYSGHWYVGYVQLINGAYLNQMMRDLGARFGERPPLERWWEPEIANLPG